MYCRQEVVISSESRNHQAEIRSLRYQLASAEASHYQLRHHLRVALVALESEEKKFSTLATGNYRLSNGCRRCASDANDERESKHKGVSDFSGAFPFHRHRYEKDENHGIVS